MKTTLLVSLGADDFDDDVADVHLVGYAHPDDVVVDPELTLFRKRQLLAYWASDIHAVANLPALRAVAGGATASIDDIQAALCKLDEMVPVGRMPSVSGFGMPG